MQICSAEDREMFRAWGCLQYLSEAQSGCLQHRGSSAAEPEQCVTQTLLTAELQRNRHSTCQELR